MSFCPMSHPQGHPIQDELHSFWTKAGSDLAQSIHYSIIPSLLVLQLEVEPCYGSNPSVTSGIQIRGCHNIGQVFLEVFCDGPFQHQELKFGRMIVLLMSSESSSTIGNWVILPICLFLGKYCSQSLLRSICFK